jgi:hypothetical protein
LLFFKKTQVTTRDFIRRADEPAVAGPNAAFDKRDYYANPGGYKCVFEELVLPYVCPDFALCFYM